MTYKPTILIADDDADLLEVLSHRCQQLGFEVRTARSALSALQCADTVVPDLIILDVNMPSGNGLSVCEMLSSDGRFRDIPIIIMTGQMDPETERRCHELAAYYVPKSTQTWERLEPLLRQLLETDSSSETIPQTPADGIQNTSRPSEEQGSTSVDLLFSALGWEATLTEAYDSNVQTPELVGPWVLAIDDDNDLSFSLKIRLAEHGVDVLRASEGLEGFRYAFATPAKAIVLDYEMPDVNGDYVLQRLKDNPFTRSIPVIVLTGHRDEGLKRRMMDLGASSFLTKPVRWDQLWDELQRHITPPPLALAHADD